MDFWARQADHRRRSRWLVVIFLVAVMLIVIAVNAVVLALLAFLSDGPPVLDGTGWAARHPQAVIVTTLVVVSVIGIAGLYKTAALGAGGGAVARTLGGVRIGAEARDPPRRRLLNVVEELAIASGIPVPSVYVLEQEEGINAFAAGHTPANAAVAVTRGALEHLSRDELQGVIGHEFSHILNGDMRLNMRLMGALFGLLVIALVARTIAWHTPRRLGGRRGEGAGLFFVAALGVMALGYIGVFFGRLIQSAVSRQREFLADASSVQFTRDTTGLKNALIKIGSVRGSRLRHPEVEEVAHMLFAPGMTRWFATHPPLAARIKALDPSFDPADFKDLRLEVTPQPLGVVEVVVNEPVPDSFRDPASLRRQYIRLDPRTVPFRVGNPGGAEMARAAAIHGSLSRGLLPGGDGAGDAVALLLALVLDPAPGPRNEQLHRIRQRLGAAVVDLVPEQSNRIRDVAPDHRLPLLGGIVPALRRLPRETRRQILECLAALNRVDGQISVFEYTLATLAQEYLSEGLRPGRLPWPVSLRDVSAELQILFSTLAAHGHGGETEAKRAYDAGIGRLSLKTAPPYRPLPGWAGAMDGAMRCLDRLAAQDKARLIEALAATVGLDGTVTVSEGELLRAVCAALHCPLPPLVGDVEASGPADVAQRPC